MPRRFVIDESWFRPRNRDLIVAGSPLRMFRVTAQGAAIADALENGSELPANHERLTSRLSAAGAIHPIALVDVPAEEITVVIPAFIASDADAHRLDQLVTSLAPHTILVIDDASPLQFQVEGATVVRRSRNGGPAAARNSAMNVVTTPYVAFVDDDVIISSETIRTAAAHCAQGAALCAPRVRDASSWFSTSSVVGRYELVRSPLDLGAKPARIQALTRVSYVPAAALVMRTESLQQCQGFDETLRVGEDVDLVWRLAAQHECRYEPTAIALHHSRSSLGAFIRQRVAYGSSAAPLSKRHGPSVSPYSSNALLFGMALMAAAGFFRFSATLAVVHVLYITASLRRAGDNIGHAFRIAIVSAFHSLRLFADALTRVWLFLYLPFTVLYPTCRWILVACFAVPGAYEWIRSRKMNPVSYLVFRTIDNVSYCMGVWKGIFAARNGRCLLPRITPLRHRAN